jgi:carbonic anhydrase
MSHTLTRRAWFGVAGATAVATLTACGSSDKAATATTTVTVSATPADTPRPAITDSAAALAELQQGNERFVSARMVRPDQGPATRLNISAAQHPFAVVLSCSDSRLPPELIFDQGLGDLFVVRVAGNIVDPAGMGSIEYAVGHFHTPLIVVLGHQNCGAVSATVDAVQHPDDHPHGSIAALVAAITPAVEAAKQESGDLVDHSVRANALQSTNQIKQSSELAAPLQAGALKVVTAYYSLKDGTVSLI